MKSYTIKFKQDNMLCDNCLTTVVKSLSALPTVKELSVSLETKKIKLKYNSKTLSKKDIQDIVNQSILTGKAQPLNR